MEQSNKQPIESVKRSKNTWIIVIAVIITALIVGGGVYAWQRSNLKKTEQSLQQQISVLQSQINQLQQIQSVQNQPNTEQNEKDEINPNIPPNFLYQSESDTIPSEYLIGINNRLNTDLIYREKGKYYCKVSGKEAKIVEYFSYSSNLPGAWSYRSAIVCENNYWIINANDASQHIYGPFEK